MTMLAVVAILSYTGVCRIIGSANDATASNRLNGQMAQNEIDHLDWAGRTYGQDCQ